MKGEGRNIRRVLGAEDNLGKNLKLQCQNLIKLWKT